MTENFTETEQAYMKAFNQERTKCEKLKSDNARLDKEADWLAHFCVGVRDVPYDCVGYIGFTDRNYDTEASAIASWRKAAKAAVESSLGMKHLSQKERGSSKAVKEKK